MATSKLERAAKASPKARRELARFVAFAKLVGVDIEPFQRLILLEVFDGRRELLVLIPRGNGKTTLFALAALWHLLTHPKPRVYLAAASKDQADIAFEVARDLVRLHPTLRKRISAQHRRLVRKDGAGFLKVISSDAGRQHGLMPTLALVDELHAHKNGDLYVALKTAMGKNPEAQLVTISTAGHDEEEALGQLRAAAIAKGQVTQADDRLRIARVEQSNFCMLEWACRDEDDLTDPKVLKLANPATFVPLAFLLEQIHSPGLHPVELATYHANVWRSGIDSWIAYGAWDKLAAAAKADAQIPEGVDVHLGVDMGRNNDCAALAVVWIRDDELAVVQAAVYRPPEKGKLAFDVIEQAIRDAADQWRVRGVAYDPWHFDRSAELLEAKGLPMVQFDQNNIRMGQASGLLYEAINNARIVHDGDPELAAHVNAGHAVQLERGFRLKKDPKAKKPIDALIAVCIAYAIARGPDERSVYETRIGDLL